MRAIVFINGLVEDYGLLQRWLRPADYWVAADGGVNHCLALGRYPDALVGDLDSVDASVVQQLMQAGVQVERHPAIKDQTDLELALEFALNTGASELVLMGAMGGRLDQMLANVLILAQRPWPVLLQLVEGRQLVQLIPPNQTVTLAAHIGDTVSAIPLSDQVTGITYTGMRYPLNNHTLHFGSTRGISNEVSESPATVRITTGRLLVIQTLATDIHEVGAKHY
jgi:thiamine pyrophosphokinase